MMCRVPRHGYDRCPRKLYSDISALPVFGPRRMVNLCAKEALNCDDTEGLEAARAFTSVATDAATSGTLPTQIALMRNMQAWLLFNAPMLSGTIPLWFIDLPSLSSINSIVSRVSGTLPTELGRFATGGDSLALLFAKSRVSGFIPTQLGLVTHLQRLQLNGNLLSGTLPSQLGALSELNTLRVDQNMLSGALPTQLSKLTQLTNNTKQACLLVHDTGSTWSHSHAQESRVSNNFECTHINLPAACAANVAAHREEWPCASVPSPPRLSPPADPSTAVALNFAGAAAAAIALALLLAAVLWRRRRRVRRRRALLRSTALLGDFAENSWVRASPASLETTASEVGAPAQHARTAVELLEAEGASSLGQQGAWHRDGGSRSDSAPEAESLAPRRQQEAVTTARDVEAMQNANAEALASSQQEAETAARDVEEMQNANAETLADPTLTAATAALQRESPQSPVGKGKQPKFPRLAIHVGERRPLGVAAPADEKADTIDRFTSAAAHTSSLRQNDATSSSEDDASETARARIAAAEQTCRIWQATPQEYSRRASNSHCPAHRLMCLVVSTLISSACLVSVADVVAQAIQYRARLRSVAPPPRGPPREDFPLRVDVQRARRTRQLWRRLRRAMAQPPRRRQAAPSQ